MRLFDKQRFSKGWAIGLVLGLASSAALVYGAVAIKSNFQTGDPVSSSEMNTNFQNIANALNCPSDMVEVGTFCIDRFEASVWSAATGGTQLDNTACNGDGNNCTNVIFARSESAVLPATSVTWFQAQQACGNVGKRLPTNAEWQMAAAGTPGSAAAATPDCNLTGTVLTTDANAACLSNFNVLNMVGNVWEWVADWNGGTFVTTADVASNVDGLGRGGGAADTAPGGNANVMFALATRLNTSLPRGGFRCAR